MKNKILVVMDQHPDLNYFGYGLRLNTSGGYLRMEPPTNQDRQNLVMATNEVERAVQWLAGAEKRKTINKKDSCYYLKDLCQHHTGGGFLSEGSFICGALIAGFDIEVVEGINGNFVHLNISQRFVRDQHARADAAGWRA